MPIYEFECGECGERFEELVAGRNGGGGLPVLRGGRRQPPALLVRAEPAADGRAEAADGGSARDRPGRCPSALQARSRPQPGAEAGLVSGATERREALVEVYQEASGCTLCPLAETRTKVVFGAGNADADLMFIGEAPGAEEDRQGLPFVGRAGGLLNELLGEIGLDRDSVFIANTLMCRPPGNRDPAARRARGVPAVPAREGRADRAEGDRHARELRDEADHRQPVRDHEGSRRRRRSTSSARGPCTSSRSSIRPRRCGRRACGRR